MTTHSTRLPPAVAIVVVAAATIAAWPGARAAGGGDRNVEVAADSGSPIRASLATAIDRPVAGLDADASARFAAGRALFRKLWVSAPASTGASDGLGPLYNARSCAQCHPGGGRGQISGEGPHTAGPALVMRLSIPRPAADRPRLRLARDLDGPRHASLPDPVYGYQLQTQAIQGHAREGGLEVAYQEVAVALADGEMVRLRKPEYRIAGLGYGPVHAAVELSPRLAPALAGLAALEAVPESVVRAWADPDDRDGDSIAGRAGEAWSQAEGRFVLGRFGWRAESPSLRQSAGVALALDIGISNPVVDAPAGDCTPAQAACLAAPDGRSTGDARFEAGETALDLLAHFLRSIDPPAAGARAQATRGAGLFTTTGCAGCHRPDLLRAARGVTGAGMTDAAGEPFTDLLLHDMGEGLADTVAAGGVAGAAGRRWRTAPLWGIGRDEAAGNARLLHDGRARTIAEAILWHGGEARRARDAFAAMERSEREALVEFVGTR